MCVGNTSFLHFLYQPLFGCLLAYYVLETEHGLISYKLLLVTLPVVNCQLSTINDQIMIKHIFKIIWAQRKSNGWILGELVIVMCALWFMMDKLWVDVRCYNAPMGYDISNTWRFKLSTLSSNAPGYVPDSLYDSNATQDLLKLMERIRQEQEVEEVCVTYLVHALFKRKFVGYAPSLGR